jgi:SAM-dependent methyltransferase
MVMRRVIPRFSSFFIHDTAKTGFTVDGIELYNKGRMDYTKTCVEKIAQIIDTQYHLNTGKNELATTIVELGAGTGKFTLSFADFSSTAEFMEKFHVLRDVVYVATEPTEFRHHLQAHCPSNIRVCPGTGSSIPCASQTADAVIVAQAFHWMDTHETLTEICRVLKPKSPLILLWNTYDYERAPWLKQIDEEVLVPLYRGTPRQQSLEWKRCFSHPAVNTFFSPLQYWHDPILHHGTFQLVVDRICSTSVIAKLGNEEKSRCAAHVRRILNSYDYLRNSTSQQIAIPYITEVAWTLKC